MDGSVSDQLFFKVCHRVQTKPGPGWGSFSELLQQDFCRLGLLHHQRERCEAEEKQFALRAQGESIILAQHNVLKKRIQQEQ